MAFRSSTSALLLLAVSCFGQQASGNDTQNTHILTDAEVSAALDRASGKFHRNGLEIIEGGGTCGNCAASSYELNIFNPVQWIDEEATQAKRNASPLTLADVTPEMRAPVLHVVAWPALPQSGAGFASASSVRKVVLADLDQKMLIQPLSLKLEEVPVSNAFRSASYSKAIATFSMEDVAKLHGTGNGEFLILVVGDTHNKAFTVKKKMFAKIF